MNKTYPVPFEFSSKSGGGSPGPQGPQGPAGTQGFQGPQGSTGSQGATGSQGPQGTPGSQGFQGTQGSTGAQGPQGNQGTQGPQGFQGFQGFQGPASSSVPWNDVTNATAPLVLNNSLNGTTFNQTTNAIWIWANTTTATIGTTNVSPAIELQANYWTGAASSLDQWSLQTSLAAGTNAVSILTVIHGGTSGAAYLSLANAGVTGLQFQATPTALDFATNTNWALDFTTGSGGVTVGTISSGASGNIGITSSPANSRVFLTGGGGSGASNNAVGIGATSSFTSTTGTVAALTIGGKSGTGGSTGFTFNPPSGSAAFIACNITPTIQGTSSGATTALVVNPTITATNLTGTNRIVSFQSGGTTELDISYTGTIATYGGTATVRRGVPSSIASSDLTAQTAAIAATTLISAPATGAYRVAWSAAITTASDTSSVLGGSGGFQVIYTSPTDSVVKTTVSGNSVTSAANTTGTAVGDDIIVYAKSSTNIQFQYGYTSVQTTTAMAFELHVSLEAL